MVEMLKLKHLKIKGFRAYMGEEKFVFDNPMILLFGENHQGKSSTLNAIEWCLFGNECIGAKSGIRERIDWEIPNRNLGSSPDVSVELELEDANNHRYYILRQWKNKNKDELTVTLPKGRPFKGKDAEDKLSQLLKSSYRDFLTTVYQHQENIRAILTQEPQQKNDAIDRLLGLSDYRNILTGIEAAKLQTKQKKLDGDFNSFTNGIGVAIRTRENDLKDKRKEATQKGLKEEQLNEDGALEIAKQVKDQLFNFASEIDLPHANLQVPEKWKDLHTFQQMVKEEIKRFRSEMPDVKKQQDLSKRSLEIANLKTKYKQAKENLDNACKELNNFVQQNGDEKSINDKKTSIEKQIEKKKKELSQANAKAAAIRNAIDYLKSEVDENKKNKCPVCEKDTPNLLEYLEKEWKKKFENQVGQIQKEINQLESQLRDIEELHKEFNKLKNNVENAKNEVGKINNQIGGFLNRGINENDDVLVILGQELTKNEQELTQLQQAVNSKQEKLNSIDSLLEQMEIIVEILNLEEKKKIVEQIRQTPEYKEMEKLKDEMAILINDIEKIKDAISEASHEEANQKIAAAENIIDRYFRRITNHSSVSKINFLIEKDSKTGRNSYEFKDQDGKDLTPILSQGDLNALALSIFLGMACSGGTNQPFGFVMLDDPSQSLGSEHKEKLVEVLDEVLKERMVILSTMDKELQDLVLSEITKTKTKYTFSNWTPQQGPQVKEEK